MQQLTNQFAQQINQQCDKCKTGVMLPNGVVYMEEPKRYEHKCTHCDNVQSYSIRYPYMIS